MPPVWFVWGNRKYTGPREKDSTTHGDRVSAVDVDVDGRRC
jgi:hypothetical protein